MNRSRGRDSHTLACLLNDLLRIFLGLEEGLDALRLTGLDEMRSDHLPPHSEVEQLPSSVNGSERGRRARHIA